MRAVNVTLRPVDLDRLEYLKVDLALQGEHVGKVTTSAAVREAIRIAYHHVQMEVAIGDEEASTDRR